MKGYHDQIVLMVHMQVGLLAAIIMVHLLLVAVVVVAALRSYAFAAKYATYHHVIFDYDWFIISFVG